MKIALITDAWAPQINGVVRTWQTVVNLLEKQGHDVRVIHPGLFRTMAMPRYPEIRLSLFPRRSLTRMLDAFEPDAIHLPTEGTLGLAGRAYCRRRRLPFTTSFHTHYAKYARAYLRVPESFTYRFLRWFHGSAERTLVPTPSVAHELEQVGMKNLVLWTRGVDTDLFRPRVGADVYQTRRPVFLYCGRVAREKNIEAFLDADLPGAKIVVGDGPELSSLRTHYPDARFVGYKTGDDLAIHLASADVFVFPSRTDTFGVVMLEAMACGLPVAAYPVTGPIDVVKDNVTGILDDDLRAAAIRALDLDPEACRAHALSYAWERCADIFFDTLVTIERDTGDASSLVPDTG